MAVRTTEYSDGISIHRETYYDAPLTDDDVRRIGEFIRNAWAGATYEGAIGPTEQYWLSVPADPKAKRWSREWYAAQILPKIAWVRDIVALRPEDVSITPARLNELVVAAMSLGTLVTEAHWRLAFGDQVRLGAGVRKGARKGGRARGQEISLGARSLDDKITAGVTAYRGKHPYSREHSTRALAKHVARKLGGVPENTVRTRLRLLRLR